ncbi:peptidoglycan editing factor PgeF [Paenibacillus sp. GCM10012307]|uniref:Purine nucleoside phosphorylase n=1 Tax=Paenibacillus roseus TaxID=2798579 RepID=A0A934J7R4_9BACL|nr:peptidoglycan editing factor PgeF [Paenibacillus roseus]MBJ6363168.1 peptidoglycan editing factor PgeF [Paenibacillus roseus]
MEPFQWKQAAKGPSLFYLSSWMEGEALTAGFTGRDGGFSKAPWQSLNMGLHVNDDSKTVVRNRIAVTEALGWPFESWTCAEQVHGARVHIVSASERGRGRDVREDAILDADALITNEPGTLLASLYADCVPLYFYDPVHRAVGLAHAGWKGTVAQIARHTVEAMTAQYGSHPSELLAAIGPSIEDCCYEVDGPVISKVEPLLKELREGGASMAPNALIADANGRARINLKEINRQIMIKAGILPTCIELSQMCTGCRTDLFFSHRMEQGKTGRMASWIGMGRGEPFS